MNAAAMERALELARDGLATGELPYGAVVIRGDGVIVGRAHDRVEAEDNLTSHAEILAVRDASRRQGRTLDGCTLVSTVEPCAMCFSAAWTAHVSRLVFGLRMRELRQEHPEAMDEITIDSDGLNAMSSRSIHITSGVLADRCWALWR
jgi:tRNA(adenine34) deaminase